MRNRSELTKAEREEIRRLYVEEEVSMMRIRGRFDLSFRQIQSVIHELGIHTRDHARKYTVNQHVFDCIDSEAAAYWLGFIYADGCVNKTCLEASQAQKDEDQIVKLTEFLETDSPIIRTNYDYGRPRSAIYVWGEHLSHRLRELNITPKRRQWEALLTEVDDAVKHHWMRGLFDGDGAADARKSIWFCGRKGLMEYLRAYFADKAGRNPNLKVSKHKTADLHYLRYKGYFNAHAVADVLYRDATVWMPRKREVIDSWKEPMPRALRARMSHIARGFNVPPLEE